MAPEEKGHEILWDFGGFFREFHSNLKSAIASEQKVNQRDSSSDEQKVSQVMYA